MRKSPVTAPAHVQHRLSKIHVLTHAELGRLFTAITSLRDQALFLVAYRHGLRATEISQMERADLEFSNTKMMIRRIGRGNDDHHALQRDEVAALKRYLKSREDESIVLFLGNGGRAITRRGLDWLMKTYGDQAKLPKAKMHFHTLKHSVATHLLSAGADLRYVHEWLGHTSLQNTAVYLYLVPTASKKTFAHPKLPGLKPD